MGALIETLGPYLLYISIGIVVLALGVLALLALMIRGAARKAEREKEEAVRAAAERATQDAAEATALGAPLPLPAPLSVSEEVSEGSAQSLRKSFAAAMKILRGHVAGRNYRYHIPWFAMVGEAGSGKTTALHGVNLNLPLGRPVDTGKDFRRGCNWWFFDRGIVLDLSGEYVLHRDGRGSDDAGWRTVLGLLQRHRPERPIDGVVLAIPATDLHGPKRPPPEVLIDKAAAVGRKLWQMQKRLGICFPVHVLVTKCDLVPGFRAFWKALPPERRDEMFGWSTPFALEKGYTPDWLEEAFRALDQGLLESQLEIAATGPAIGDGNGDGAFLFPGEFASLRGPLGIYLDEIFRPSVYHESFFVRGIYFAGDIFQGEAGPAPARAADAGAGPVFAAPAGELGLAAPATVRPAVRPIMVTHLFGDKVFPEHVLARPASNTLLSRNRSVLAAQGALAASVVVLGLGLWLSHNSLRSDMRGLEPVLKDVADDILRLRQQGAAAPESALSRQEQALFRQFKEASTRRLLDAMTRIKTNTLGSVFIPSSWFSDIDRRVSAFIAHGFDQIIMRAMYDQLDQRVQRVLSAAAGPAAAAPPSAAAAGGQIEDMPEYAALTGVVAELKELEDNIKLYNGLGSSENLDGLVRLAQYLFGIQMPREIFAYPEFYLRAIEHVRQRAFDIARYKGRAAARVRDMAWRLFERVFHAGALATQLHELTLGLRAVETPSRDVEAEATAFKGLLDALDRVDRLLASPEMEWLAGNEFNLGLSFAETLAAIGQSGFLGPDIAVELVNQGQSEFDRFKLRLGAYRARLVGPVLERNGDAVRLRLAEPLVAMRAALAEMFGQPFMVVGARQDINTTYSPARRLVWNARVLDEAVRLYEAFDRFTVGHLAALPRPLQGRARDLALARLDANMVTTVARAAETQAGGSAWRGAGEDTLGREIQDFRRASPLLAQILNIFRTLELTTSFGGVRTLTLLHAGDLLARSDRLLDGEGLYLPAEPLAGWTGTEPPMAFAFQARDDAEILHYLDVQRERVEFLLREYVEPMLVFLSDPAFQRDVGGSAAANRWRRIFEELGKYNKRQPGSSVTALEKFIRFDMAETTAANCIEKLGGAANPPSADFFLSRRNALRQQLLDRCRQLGTDKSGSRYLAMADTFNRTLAGAYPFAAIGPGAPIRDADADAIRAFFHLYDAEAKAVREALAAGRALGPAAAQAIAFVDQMAAARAFLAPVLEAERSGQPPQFDVAVDFRVNRGAEAGGNQIIEWALWLGGKKITRGDQDLTAIWRPGDSVRITLRWAKDAPRRPLAGKAGAERVEDEAVVVYEFKNVWSLIRLLEVHAGQPSDFAKGTDPAPHTLRFEIQNSPPPVWLNPDIAAATDKVEDKTRVYIWVGIKSKAAEGQPPAPLSMPFFPRRAPALTGPTN